MIELHYPDAAPKTRDHSGNKEVFDPVRKRWIQLTPEEWVRQQFIQLLALTHGYPLSLMAAEQSFSLGSLQKRFDLLVFDRSHKPLMMIECKAPAITLDESVLSQLLRYNISIPVRYLLITNGPHCLGWERDGKTILPLEKIPDFTG